MGRGHRVTDAVGNCDLGERQGVLQFAGPVVDAGQQVAVDVDQDGLA